MEQLKILVAADTQNKLAFFGMTEQWATTTRHSGGGVPVGGVFSFISTFLVSTVSSMGTLAAGGEKKHTEAPRVIMTARKQQLKTSFLC